MKIGKLRFTAGFTVLWIIILLLAVTTATYAWFTFTPYTKVTPMAGSVSKGDGNLLIANAYNGPYDVTCALTPESTAEVLWPVSTADLENFYVAAAQNDAGISYRFAGANDRVNTMVVYGRVYLQSAEAGHDVYFDPDVLGFGNDNQALAAMRLGLRITSANGVATHIFALDDMGSTGGAEARRTVAESNTVVGSVGSGGQATLVRDPAESLSSYFARGNDTSIVPGQARLTALRADEIATVEYWLYLEGCDENCINTVQSRDVALQLAFAGIQNDL